MRSQPNYPPACTPYGPSADYFAYGYLPSRAAGIVFSVTFGFILCTHVFQIFSTRAWWMVFFAIGSGLETLGWIGRAIAHESTDSTAIDSMQTTVLIMSPAWTQAGVYTALQQLILHMGKNLSPLKPAVYLWACFAFDTVALGLQAVGGGIAGSAAASHDSPTLGT